MHPGLFASGVAIGAIMMDSMKSWLSLGIMKCFARFPHLRVESNAGSCDCPDVVVRCLFREASIYDYSCVRYLRFMQLWYCGFHEVIVCSWNNELSFPIFLLKN